LASTRRAILVFGRERVLVEAAAAGIVVGKEVQRQHRHGLRARCRHRGDVRAQDRADDEIGAFGARRRDLLDCRRGRGVVDMQLRPRSFRQLAQRKLEALADGACFARTRATGRQQQRDAGDAAAGYGWWQRLADQFHRGVLRIARTPARGIGTAGQRGAARATEHRAQVEPALDHRITAGCGVELDAALARLTQQLQQPAAGFAALRCIGTQRLGAHLGAHRVHRAACGQRNAHARVEVAGGRRAGRFGQRLDALPGELRAPVHQRELGLEQRALVALLRRGRRCQAVEHALRIGSTARVEPAACRVQQEASVLRGGAPGGQRLVHLRGLCMIATLRRGLGAFGAGAGAGAGKAGRRWQPGAGCQQQRERETGERRPRVG